MSGFAEFFEMAAELATFANEVESDVAVVYESSKEIFEKLRELGSKLYDSLPGKHSHIPKENFELANSHSWMYTPEAINILTIISRLDVSTLSGRITARKFLMAYVTTKSVLRLEEQISTIHTYVAITVQPFLDPWVKLNTLLSRPLKLSEPEELRWLGEYELVIQTLFKAFDHPFKAVDIQTMFNFAWHKL